VPDGSLCRMNSVSRRGFPRATRCRSRGSQNPDVKLKEVVLHRIPDHKPNRKEAWGSGEGRKTRWPAFDCREPPGGVPRGHWRLARVGAGIGGSKTVAGKEEQTLSSNCRPASRPALKGR